MTVKNITRSYLSEKLQTKHGMNRVDSLIFIQTILKEISESLKQDQHIKIPLFGVFTPKQKNSRVGRNPRTLEKADISARRVVGFRVSRLMKNRINTSFNNKA